MGMSPTSPLLPNGSCPIIKVRFVTMIKRVPSELQRKRGVQSSCVEEVQTASLLIKEMPPIYKRRHPNPQLACQSMCSAFSSSLRDKCTGYTIYLNLTERGESFCKLHGYFQRHTSVPGGGSECADGKCYQFSNGAYSTPHWAGNVLGGVTWVRLATLNPVSQSVECWANTQAVPHRTTTPPTVTTTTTTVTSTTPAGSAGPTTTPHSRPRPSPIPGSFHARTTTMVVLVTVAAVVATIVIAMVAGKRAMRSRTRANRFRASGGSSGGDGAGLMATVKEELVVATVKEELVVTIKKGIGDAAGAHSAVRLPGTYSPGMPLSSSTAAGSPAPPPPPAAKRRAPGAALSSPVMNDKTLPDLLPEVASSELFFDPSLVPPIASPRIGVNASFVVRNNGSSNGTGGGAAEPPPPPYSKYSALAIDTSVLIRGSGSSSGSGSGMGMDTMLDSVMPSTPQAAFAAASVSAGVDIAFAAAATEVTPNRQGATSEVHPLAIGEAKSETKYDHFIESLSLLKDQAERAVLARNKVAEEEQVRVEAAAAAAGAAAAADVTRKRCINADGTFHVWVLELGAKQRNQLVGTLALTPTEKYELIKACRHHKQHKSKRKYAARKRAEVAAKFPPLPGGKGGPGGASNA